MSLGFVMWATAAVGMLVDIIMIFLDVAIAVISVIELLLVNLL